MCVGGHEEGAARRTTVVQARAFAEEQEDIESRRQGGPVHDVTTGMLTIAKRRK